MVLKCPRGGNECSCVRVKTTSYWLDSELTISLETENGPFTLTLVYESDLWKTPAF